MGGVDDNSPDGSQYSRQQICRPGQLGHPTDNSKTEVKLPQFMPRLVKMSIVDFERILSDIRQFADVAKDLAELQEFLRISYRRKPAALQLGRLLHARHQGS